MMSRKLVFLGWSLVVASLVSVGVLQWALVARLDNWLVFPFALLAHGALLPAVGACGLAWLSNGGRSLRFASTALTAVVVVAWLFTWFVPIKVLGDKLAVTWYLWLGV